MDKRVKLQRRKKTVRKKVYGTAEKPRLSVFRSNRYLYAQVIDDDAGKTLVAVSPKDLGKDVKGKNGIQLADLLGAKMAESAKVRKIKKIVFDRNGLKYHGQVKAFAEAARKGGIDF